jgi:hypothetical protein
MLRETLPGYDDVVSRIAALLPTPKVPVVPRSVILRKTMRDLWCDGGAHITQSTKYGKPLEEGVTHCDYEGLAPYPEALFDKTTQAFSAMLCLEAPAAGGGLELWNSRATPDYLPSLDDVPSLKLPYFVGTLTVLDSFLPHKIMACTYSKQAPRRVVMVVHFLYRNEPYPHVQFWF